jgi:hypothetical protein
VKTARAKVSTSHALIEKPPYSVVPKDDAQGPFEEVAAGPSEEQIRRAAYALYEARGGADGNDLDDWLKAKAQLAGDSAGTGRATH